MGGVDFVAGHELRDLGVVARLDRGVGDGDSQLFGEVGITQGPVADVGEEMLFSSCLSMRGSFRGTRHQADVDDAC